MQDAVPRADAGRSDVAALPRPDRTAGPDLAVALRVRFRGGDPGRQRQSDGAGLAAAEVVAVEGAEGGTALRLAFTGRAGPASTSILGEYDASTATALAMRLRLPDEVAQLELKLEGPETNTQSVNLIDYAADRDEAGWRTVPVPLAEFDRIDLSQAGHRRALEPADRARPFVACEVLVDDVRFD